jgi:flagellar hook-associated protein 2
MATDIIGALGGGAGFDSTKLVEDLVAVQKAPQQARLDARSERYDTQLSSYGVYKSALSEFQNVLTPLSDPALFDAKSINVPTTDVVSFNSLTAQAQAGSYQLEVEKIATSQSIAFNTPETDKNQALNKSGTLTFKIGEWGVDGGGDPLFTVNADKTSFEVAVTTDDSLETIAGKINLSNSGVLASVISIDGKLQLLVSAESGLNNALEVTSDNTAQLGVFEYNTVSIAALDPVAPSVIETQKGGDAEFKLNGLLIKRESNQVSDVIPGLDFTLNKADIGNNVSFSISQDKSSAETAIRGLVEAYNTLREVIKPIVGVTEGEDSLLVSGALSKDSTAKTLFSALVSTVRGTVNGLSQTDKFSALASIGVVTERDGTIKIDDEQFNKVISEDFASLSSLFGVQSTSESSFLELKTGSFAGKAVVGNYTVDITQAPTQGSVLSGVVAFPVVLADDSATFTVQIDGVSSESIVLKGVFNTAEELAAGLQSVINSDKNYQGNNLSVEVNVEGGGIKIESTQFGTSSKVEFTAVSAPFDAQVGFNTSSTTTIGVNAKGTINGQEAFGSSNILLPAIGSDAYGLNVTVSEATPVGSYGVSFTRGFAGELSLLISNALADGGQIENKEESISQERKVLAVDQEKLDRKMTSYQSRLSSQFTAMERIVASLNQTKGQLDGLIDRLPFTAKK